MQQRAKALKNFKTDPDTSVFLLSMKAGAVGINLTQANRVFLIEPALNPALDAQAIGRVHRLGKKRQVEVVRLIVENSIETRILRKNSYPVVGISKQESEMSLEGGEEHTESSSTAISTSGDSTRPLSLAEENNSSALSSDIIGHGDAMVGSLKSDKTMLKVEHFDELFGFKALEGRWRC
jgi:superfamily II DNA or RNA helicase